jgi:hypothetical protein
MIASTIRQAMGSNAKLVTTATYQSSCTNLNFCNPAVPDIGHVINGEHAGADVDFWGVDIYSPGPGAAYLRQYVFAATTKPFFLPEYGVAYEPTLPGTIEEKSVQEFNLIREVEQYSNEPGRGGNEFSTFDDDAPVYSGGLLFEWNDEFWKGPIEGAIPCARNPASAQGWYGKNELQLKPGCQCVAPELRTAACAMDDLAPRPILSDPSLLPSLWNTYVPSAYAPPAPSPTPSPPSSWIPCRAERKVCCNPHASPLEYCPDGTACQECGGGNACECPQSITGFTNSTLIV